MEVESYPKRAHRQPDDRYGRAGRALSLSSPGPRAHSGQHLRDSRACWTPRESVSGRSPTVNGPHVLVIRPSVEPALPVSPPSPRASEETGPR